MVYVGIDVAKSKHDCYVINSDGEILIDSFSFPNSSEGFNSLYHSLISFSSLDKIKVGLEATGHYSNNILNFLITKGFNTYVINPLHTNLYRKGHSLRKTKTDKSDARFIATMLITENLKPYLPVSYHISELKSLTRHRFRIVFLYPQQCRRYNTFRNLWFDKPAARLWTPCRNCRNPAR